MTTTDTQAKALAPNYVHDELAFMLQRLVRLRREREQAHRESTRRIEELEILIEKQVFSALPGIAENTCYSEGDPIEFFAGSHRVRLYSIKDKIEIEIDRGHALETGVDLFADTDEEAQ